MHGQRGRGAFDGRELRQLLGLSGDCHFPFACAGRHPSPALASDGNLQEMGPCLRRGPGSLASIGVTPWLFAASRASRDQMVSREDAKARRERAAIMGVAFPSLQGRGAMGCGSRLAVKPSPLQGGGLGGGVLYAGPSQLRLIGTADKPSHLSPEGERAIGCAALGHRFGEKNKTRSGASRFNALGNHEMRGAAGSHSSPRGPSHGQRPEVPPSECMSRLMKAPALTKGQMAISREHSEWT